MNEAGSDPTQGFMVHQTRTVDRNAQLLGFSESWIAPVSFLTAPTGFGEAAWIPQMPVTVLAMRLSGAPVECCFGPASGRESAGFAPTLQPRGTPNHFRSRARVTFAQIFLDDGLIDRVACGLRPGASACGRLRDDLAFTNDAELNARSLAYIRAAKLGDDVSDLEMEARAILVLERLLGHYHGFKPSPVSHTGLSPWQLKRVKDFLDERLADEPRLEALAREARLSPFHFSRAFKASTGLPPHRYLIQIRLERARELLEATNLAMTEISARVGYDDPGYLARLFRRHFGATPAAYRRERQS